MYPRMSQLTFLENKYTQLYFRIIEQARSNISLGYTEKHHIIPKSLGGTNQKSNMITLSARQHFVCHLLLVKMTTGRDQYKMICAAHHMSVCHRRAKYKITSITYERLKRQRSESMKGTSNPMYGKSQNWTAEARANLSRSLRSSEALKNRGDTWKQHISEAQSRGIVIINSVTGEIFGEWPNCSKAAIALNCTRAGIKAAIRNGTHIGIKMSSLNHTRHWVRWKDDIDAKPSISLEDLRQISSQASLNAWEKRRSPTDNQLS